MKETKRESEMEQLLRPDSRKGPVVVKGLYERIRTFILSELDDEYGKTLHDILEKAQSASVYAQTQVGDKSWFILQVKLDLEARGLIKTFMPDYKRANFLKITRQGQRILRQEREMTEF